MATFHIPGYAPVVVEGGIISNIWRGLFEQLAANVTSIGASLAAVPGVNRWVLADQPSLGASDEGYVAFVSDYGHFVRWTGTVWEFAAGDVGNLFLRDYVGAPQDVGWQLCDGTATDYLTVGGATLTATAFTTPNLTGTPAYKKAAAAYTGTINAKGGSTGTGSTGTGSTGTGTTGNESAHTHSVNIVSGETNPVASIVSDVAGATVVDNRHTHNVVGTTAAGSAHSHSVPALSVPALSVPALGVGSIEMANIGVLPYFRR